MLKRNGDSRKGTKKKGKGFPALFSLTPLKEGPTVEKRRKKKKKKGKKNGRKTL